MLEKSIPWNKLSCHTKQLVKICTTKSVWWKEYWLQITHIHTPLMETLLEEGDTMREKLDGSSSLIYLGGITHSITVMHKPSNWLINQPTNHKEVQEDSTVKTLTLASAKCCQWRFFLHNCLFSNTVLVCTEYTCSTLKTLNIIGFTKSIPMEPMTCMKMNIMLFCKVGK